MPCAIAKRQNYVYICMILATVAITVFCYRTFQKKWIIYRKAEDKFKQEKFNEAISLYQQALALGPIGSQAFVHLADAYVAEGYFSESLKWYRTYLELFPKDTEVRFSYAQALNWSGNIKDADLEYKKYIKDNESNQNP